MGVLLGLQEKETLAHMAVFDPGGYFVGVLIIREPYHLGPFMPLRGFYLSPMLMLKLATSVSFPYAAL